MARSPFLFLDYVIEKLHVHGRTFEWASTLVMSGFALTLALPGDTLAAPSYKTIYDLGIDDAALGVVVGVVSAFRASGLIINGYWRRSPMLRMIGSIFGSALFGTIALSILWPYVNGEVSSLAPGFGTYFVLALFDNFSAYRSGADVRVSKQFAD